VTAEPGTHLLLDVAEADRIELVQRLELASRIPPLCCQGREASDLRLVDRTRDPIFWPNGHGGILLVTTHCWSTVGPALSRTAVAAGRRNLYGYRPIRPASPGHCRSNTHGHDGPTRPQVRRNLRRQSGAHSQRCAPRQT